MAPRPPPEKKSLSDRAGIAFSRFAKGTSTHAGRPSTFAIAVFVIVAWAVTGPLFDYSDTWQLMINTATTIVTFLMVFLIQNTQNRDSQAIHVKLDELIRAKKGARNSLLDLEDLSDDELHRLQRSFAKLGRRERKRELLEAIEDEAEDIAQSK